MSEPAVAYLRNGWRRRRVGLRMSGAAVLAVVGREAVSTPVVRLRLNTSGRAPHHPL